jgi:hypothetical protein
MIIVLNAEENTQYLGQMGDACLAIDKHRYGNGQENKIFAFFYTLRTREFCV